MCQQWNSHSILKMQFDEFTFYFSETALSFWAVTVNGMRLAVRLMKLSYFTAIEYQLNCITRQSNRKWTQWGMCKRKSIVIEFDTRFFTRTALIAVKIWGHDWSQGPKKRLFRKTLHENTSSFNWAGPIVVKVLSWLNGTRHKFRVPHK